MPDKKYITATQFFTGAEDGYTVRKYEAGGRYFVPVSFADSVIRSGLANDDIKAQPVPGRRGRRRK